MRNPFLGIILHFEDPKKQYPRWSPDAIFENLNFLNNCHRILYNMSFYRFSGMRNPIIHVFLHCEDLE